MGYGLQRRQLVVPLSEHEQLHQRVELQLQWQLQQHEQLHQLLWHPARFDGNDQTE